MSTGRRRVLAWIRTLATVSSHSRPAALAVGNTVEDDGVLEFCQRLWGAIDPSRRDDLWAAASRVLNAGARRRLRKILQQAPGDPAWAPLHAEDIPADRDGKLSIIRGLLAQPLTPLRAWNIGTLIAAMANDHQSDGLRGLAEELAFSERLLYELARCPRQFPRPQAIMGGLSWSLVRELLRVKDEPRRRGLLLVARRKRLTVAQIRKKINAKAKKSELVAGKHGGKRKTGHG